MKIGLDIHGVCDTKKKFFSIFSQRLLENGHIVHIITGSMRTPQIEQRLKQIGIKYNYFFSISDKLIKEGKFTHWSDENNPWFDSKDWDCAKAEYCKDNQIDIHFDDSDEYVKYFETLYVKVF
ncbi:MAG: hypothetical protein ACOC2U_05245 [bacterium]